MQSAKVGRYALIKMIGRGGMADVWIGKSFGAGGFEKIVAIKLLAPDNVEKEEYQRALTDEARVLVHLKHPNIVDIYDLNFEAENPYLVMEYVEGAELRDILKALRLKKIRMPFAIAAHIIEEVAKALHHAHERRDPQTGEPLHIVHRDISPSNILMSSLGDVKLSDFGIAKSSLQSSKTQVGLIKGKFRYMSPEQAVGAALDHRSDLFSLGLVLYECVFGEPAYDDPSDVKILDDARAGRVKIPPCSEAVSAIFLKLFAKNPADRFSDAQTLRRELEEVRRESGERVERDDLSQFLKNLDLAQVKNSTTARQQAEEWNPMPTSQVLVEDGHIATLADIELLPKRRPWWWVAAAVAVVVISVTLWMEWPRPKESILATTTRALSPAPTQGSLSIETTPIEALVQVKYGDIFVSRPAPIALADIPFGVPVEVTVSKKGYRSTSKRLTLSAEKSKEVLALVLAEIKGLQVRFAAEPYAEVFIPGQFSSLETPTGIKTLPPGVYTVNFIHPPTKRQATAVLYGKEGGEFLCSADMSLADPTAEPKATCRSRP